MRAAGRSAESRLSGNPRLCQALAANQCEEGVERPRRADPVTRWHIHSVGANQVHSFLADSVSPSPSPERLTRTAKRVGEAVADALGRKVETNEGNSCESICVGWIIMEGTAAPRFPAKISYQLGASTSGGRVPGQKSAARHRSKVPVRAELEAIDQSAPSPNASDFSKRRPACMGVLSGAAVRNAFLGTRDGLNPPLWWATIPARSGRGPSRSPVTVPSPTGVSECRMGRHWTLRLIPPACRIRWAWRGHHGHKSCPSSPCSDQLRLRAFLLSDHPCSWRVTTGSMNKLEHLVHVMCMLVLRGKNRQLPFRSHGARGQISIRLATHIVSPARRHAPEGGNGKASLASSERQLHCIDHSRMPRSNGEGGTWTADMNPTSVLSAALAACKHGSRTRLPPRPALHYDGYSQLVNVAFFFLFDPGRFLVAKTENDQKVLLPLPPRHPARIISVRPGAHPSPPTLYFERDF